MLGRKSPLLGDALPGCGGAEVVDSDGQSVWADDPLPSEGGGPLDRHSGDPLPEDLCAIVLVLGEEELPAREADHSCSNPVFGQEIGRLEGDVDLAAGGDQNDVVTVPEDVA